MKPSSYMFRDQIQILSGWFKGWNESEQTVALLSLLKRVSGVQAKFLVLCLEQSFADSSDIQVLQEQANNPVYLSCLSNEPKESVVSQLLSRLPLLKPGNADAKAEYMKLLPKILADSIEHGRHLEESRQLLSYSLIHPAISNEERSSLALWLTHLEQRSSALENQQNGGTHDISPADQTQYGYPADLSYQGNGFHSQKDFQGGRINGWRNQRDSGIVSSWQDLSGGMGGFIPGNHAPVQKTFSGPANMNPSNNQAMGMHQRLRRSNSLTPPTSIPIQPDWAAQDDVNKSRSGSLQVDHAPLSPQSSVASSGSAGSGGDNCDEPQRNTFNEEGSGMKDVPTWLKRPWQHSYSPFFSQHENRLQSQDVPAWLKSLRLHKYAPLFSQLTYDEMMNLTEEQLEAQGVTKGARHKIVLSIQKLKERQTVLQQLEKDILELGNLRSALLELKSMLITPIKPYTPLADSPSSADEGSDEKSPPPSPAATTDGESSTVPIPEGDLPGQFTRVMGKACTQLLVSRPDDENVNLYLQLIDKTLIHEAFSNTQKKRLLSWKQQVQKLLRNFPRRSSMDSGRQPRGWGPQHGNTFPNTYSMFGGVGSFATAGSVAGQRGPRPQFPRRQSYGGSKVGMMGGGPPANLRTMSNPTDGPYRKQDQMQRAHATVQRTKSAPVRPSQPSFMFPRQDYSMAADPTEINNRLESLCLSMTEHALADGADRTSTF
ncbi:SAMD4B [Branchiostoma lanceolatum]|uniref:SAMD4B protein n=1 Tax=Branchiostoma lanceolatum TaxID=7740 RepID=A0A8J9ZUM5_BRALA|nr:SAMD4B [Branchiostoma lanceolatum]